MSKYRLLCDECRCDSIECSVRSTCLRWLSYDPKTTEHVPIIRPTNSGPMCRYYWYVTPDSGTTNKKDHHDHPGKQTS